MGWEHLLGEPSLFGTLSGFNGYQTDIDTKCFFLFFIKIGGYVKFIKKCLPKYILIYVLPICFMMSFNLYNKNYSKYDKKLHTVIMLLNNKIAF